MYDPPYAREIDDLFVRNLVKYLAPVSSLRVGARSVDSAAQRRAESAEGSRGPGGSRMHVVEQSGPESEEEAPSVLRVLIMVEVPISLRDPQAKTRRIGFVYEEEVSDAETVSGNGTVSGDGSISDAAAASGDRTTSDADTVGFAVEVTEADLDVLYRLRPEDIIHRLADVLYLVAQWEPALFSERGRTNLERLASREARAATVRATDQNVTLTYVDDSAACCLSLQASSTAPDCVIVSRRPARPPASVSARPYARSA